MNTRPNRRSGPALWRPLAWACAALLASASPWTGAGTIDRLPGRLFHTPAERAALDGAGHAPPGAHRQRPGGSAPQVRPDARKGLRGFVLRSDGQDSYWVERLPDAPGAEAAPAR